MANDPLQYDKMIQSAFRAVVREALAEVAEHGLSGRHHFYITFRTDHPGVDIPDYLGARYPHEMTIVLEHQFWGLEVGDDAFAVTLSFDKMNERLGVPLAAVTRFVDPGANFGLRLQATAPDGTPLGPLPGPAGEGEEAPTGEAGPGERETGPELRETEPGQRETQPGEREAEPELRETEPGQRETQPGEREAEAAKRKGQPAREKARPAREKAQPAREKAQLAREKAQLAKEKVHLAKEKTQPGAKVVALETFRKP